MAGETLNGFDVAKLMARMNANNPTGGPMNVPGSSQAMASAIGEGRPGGNYSPPVFEEGPGLSDYVGRRQPPGYSGGPGGTFREPVAGTEPLNKFSQNTMDAAMRAAEPTGGPLRARGSSAVMNALANGEGVPGYTIPVGGNAAIGSTPIPPRAPPGYNARQVLDPIARAMAESEAPGMSDVAARMSAAGFEAAHPAELHPVVRGMSARAAGMDNVAARMAASGVEAGTYAPAAEAMAGGGLRAALGGAARMAAPLYFAKTGYDTANELMDANSDPRRRFAAAGQAFDAGNYGDAAKNAYFGVGDVIGSLTGLKPMVRGVADMMRPAPPAPITYDPQAQAFSRAPTNMEEYKQMQQAKADAMKTAAYPGGVTQGGTPVTSFDNVSGMGRATPDDLRGAYARLNEQRNQVVPGGQPQQPTTAGQSILGDFMKHPNDYYNRFGANGTAHLLQQAAALQNADTAARGGESLVKYRDAMTDFTKNRQNWKPSEQNQAALNASLDAVSEAEAALMTPEVQNDPVKRARAQAALKFYGKDVTRRERGMKGNLGLDLSSLRVGSQRDPLLEP